MRAIVLAEDIFSKIRSSRWTFLFVFVAAALITYAFLYAIGFTPEPVSENPNVLVTDNTKDSNLENVEAEVPVDSTPLRIIIDSIGVNAPINNPESNTISVLDRELLSGVVRYPGSGDLEDRSNLFLFGHSSFLPVVQNEMFRVFNNLEKVNAGDLIRVQSGGYEYRYSVTSVVLVDADEALVELSNREKKLTLSTCNSFGAKSERFVVEADFLGRVAI